MQGVRARGASLLGCAVEEMLHRSVFNFIFPEDLAEGRHTLAKLFQGVQEEADIQMILVAEEAFQAADKSKAE